MNLALQTIKFDFYSGKISAADAVAITLVLRVLKEKGRRSLQGKRTSLDPVAIANDILLKDYDSTLTDNLPTVGLWNLIQDYRIHGLQDRIQWVLLAWKAQKIFLHLTEKIPTPLEILKHQTKGERVVTVFWDPEKIGQQITATKNDFQFTLHDLEHAERFLTQDHQGQINFYQALHQLLLEGHLSDLVKDPAFCEDFNYLMSDMNSHPEHQRQYLNAILIKAQKRSQFLAAKRLTESDDQFRGKLLARLTF